MNTIEDSINQRISARIRIERESRGWSLTELAERAGVSREENLRRKLIRLLVHKHDDHLEYTDEHRDKVRELSRASVVDSKQLRRDASTLAKDIVDRKANASPSDLVTPRRGEAVAASCSNSQALASAPAA